MYLKRIPPARLLAVLLAFALLLSPLLPGARALAQESGTVSPTLTTRLNVRSGPSATAAIVGKLPAGSAVQILGASDDGAWLRVSAAALSGEGWVSAAFVVRGGALAATPAPGGLSALVGAARGPVRATATATPAAASGVLLPTATPAANATPAAAAEAVAAAAATAAETAAPTEPTAYVATASINVRGGPGTNYARISGATQGTALVITGVAPDGAWYRVRLPGSDGAGWVAAALVTTAGPQAPTLSDTDIPAPPAPAASAVLAPAAGGAAVGAAPLPTGGGGFAYGLTANMWQRDKASVGGLLNDLGATWVKQQVRWEFVEDSPGAVNWSETDAIVAQMNAVGVNVAFSVVTAPGWSRPNLGGTNGPPEDFQLFANFAGALAGRYCGQSLRAIEVWNEQNLRREWEGFALDPALYMDLLKRAYASIKAACPSMIVISGATTPAGYSDVAFDDVDYLRGMYQNGLARYSDGVGIHPSGFANPPGVRFSDWQSGAYSAESHVNHRSFYFLSTLEESRAVMVQFGDSGKKLWPTEFGWGSTSAPEPGYEYEARISLQQQADWITEAYRIMANSGYVGAAFLWNLNYDFGEMQHFAIVGRPAYDALKAQIRR